MIRTILALSASVMLLTTPAHAAMTARGLHTLCESAQDMETTLCVGYIVGVMDYALVTGLTPICPPAGYPVNDLKASVLSFLRITAPSRTDEMKAVVAVTAALSITFPCDG